MELRISVLIVLMVAGIARAEQPPSVNELLWLAIDTHERREVIQQARSEAIGDRPARLDALWSMEQYLTGEPADERTIERLRETVAQHEDQVKTGREHGNDAFVKSAEQSLDRARRQLEAALLQDADERAALKAKVVEERKALEAELVELEAPFKPKLRALDQRIKPHEDALASAIKGYFKNVTNDAFRCELTAFHADVRSGFISCRWQDADEKQVAWAHVRLRSASDAPAHSEENKLDGEYPLQAMSNSQMWVWAGPALVTFVPTADALRSEDRLKEQIYNFVDLAGLAKIEPTPGRFAETDGE